MRASTSAPPVLRPRGLFRDLDRPLALFSHLTPNWYASVMGTGIVATAAASLPVQPPGLRAAATIVWVAATVLLVAVTAATGWHWLRYRAVARTHHRHPVMAHFYGAPPMALLTVGAGAVLLGKDLIGVTAAVALDAVLWVLGTVLGVCTAVLVPFLAFTRHVNAPAAAFGGWLMPVVPPMVSASTGALLLPYCPAGPVREGLLTLCGALFGVSLVASMIIITLIWNRLMHHEMGPAALVPTLWIVLGPLGQSVTAATLLATNADTVVDPFTARVLVVGAQVYGFAMIGFALLWAGIASAVTLRTARRGLPFSLTWWSFTFPIGTCVTGLSGLAVHSGLVLIDVLAVAAYGVLVLAWVIVASRTFHGSVLSGRLLVPASVKPD
ncbi:TDT family transporter [Microbacterium sp. p3-SID338]|nr:TDT family transporter [Microbacterium sp. p3-SID338]MCT1394861.1 TDT family transporter [Microbacterium sp. p3-SID338]